MSGEENNDNANIMELMKSMFSSMSDQFNSNMNDMDHNISNNMNSIRDDMNSNNDMVNARIESLQERIASRVGSRAVNPSTLAAKLNNRIKVEPIDLATDTPRAYAPREDISMTAIIKNNEDANAFADENPMARLICCSQPSEQPTQRGTFTTATPEVTAYLDGPLTLTKCLEFERLLLEYSQRYNVEISKQPEV